MPKRFSKQLDYFKKNMTSVMELVNFDKIILDLCISKLAAVDDKLSKTYHDNHSLRVTSTVKQLQNIRKHQSTEINYKTIYNQSLVLLVSYFSRIVEDIFEMHLEDRLLVSPLDAKKVGKLDEVTLSLNELSGANFNLTGRIGQIVIDKNGYNFQNMGSIKRAFLDFYDYEIDQDYTVNNLIVATELRNCIVHTGSLLEEKSLQKIIKAKTTPRNLKPNLERSQEITFTPDEVKLVSESMIEYLLNINKNIIEPLLKDVKNKGAQEHRTTTA